MPRYLQYLYSGTRRNARTRHIPFCIDMDDFKTVLARADGRCEVTGIEFDFEFRPGKNRPFAPSIDRIDSARGYSPDNIRLVCGITNTALSDWGMGPVLTFAKALIAKTKTA